MEKCPEILDEFHNIRLLRHHHHDAHTFSHSIIMKKRRGEKAAAEMESTEEDLN